LELACSAVPDVGYRVDSAFAVVAPIVKQEGYHVLTWGLAHAEVTNQALVPTSQQLSFQPILAAERALLLRAKFGPFGEKP
jgi:hypothetical protein